MNRRKTKLYVNGTSLVVTIPKDWVQGMELSRGDELEMLYDGQIVLRKPETPE
jgi:antitoxin component of MazEF toxin-antitoxin module